MTRLFFAVAAIIAITATSAAHAQELQQPASIEATAFNYDYYAQDDAQPSPSDVPVAPPGAGGPMADACGCGCDSGCGGCGGCCGGCCYDYCDYDPCECCRWSLCDNSCRSWQVGGWFSAGGTIADDDPPSNFLTPLAFNDRSEEFIMNQLWMYAEKSVTDCYCGWDIGGRIDLMYGTDHRFTQAVGWELNDDGTAHWNSNNPSHLYGLAMPQWYVEVGNANASILVGHYYTLIGYESVPANNNFFYSHAYTMLYGEPFTHTGVLGRYAYSDQTQLYLGVNNRWDTVDATSDRPSVLMGATWESCNCRGSISAFLTAGKEFDNFAAPTVDSNRYMYSLVGTYWLTPNLQYVLQHDNAWQEDYFVPGVDAEWYGVNQYLFYTINDCWKAGARLEWFRDDDGVRVPTSLGNNFAGNYYEFTVGANWSPNCNLIVRPEVRWDWFDGVGNPFLDETADDMLSAAIDVIFLY